MIKKEFRGLVLRIYEEENKTYEEMAKNLMMDKRSFADIASGKHKCGELTILLLLLHLQDPNSFLQHLKQEMESVLRGK